MPTHTHVIPALPKFAKPLTGLLAALVLSGCASLQPEALRLGEISETVKADRAAAVDNIEPLTGPLTLEEAVARAIKYNSERRLKAMEEAVAYGTFETGKFDMLPKLVASAGYRSRNNDLITNSKDSVTGQPSLANPYISSSREAFTGDLGFSWSLLDFGQSYYAAKQNANRVQIATERRRKAVHNLIQDVRTAYWRVVAAEKLGATLRSTIQEAESALEDSRKAEAEQLRSPLEPLRYQRQLLENVRLLEAIEQELSTARIELASLVQLPLAQSGQPIQVVEPSSGIKTPWLDVPIEDLEARALMLNPDLRESFYNARIAQEETRRVMLKFFPGVSFNYALRSSSDSYLINDAWREAGAQISFNLLGMLAVPAQMRLAEAGVALAEQRRVTTQMVVLTQLHIARLQYANAAHQFERADSIAMVDSRIADHVSNQARVEKQTQLDRISQQTTSILSMLRRYQALSAAMAAASRLQATLGMEASVEGTADMPLKDLTAAVAQSLQSWDSGRLPALAETAPAPGQD